MSTLHTLAQVPASGALEDALADSLAGISFADTTFYAATRRGQGPAAVRAVCANSRILAAASPYFRMLLAEGRDEAVTPKCDNVSDDDSDVDEDEVLEVSKHIEKGKMYNEEEFEPLSGAPSEFSLDDLEALEGQPIKPSSVRLENERSHYQGVPSNCATDGTKVVHLKSVAADTLEAAIFYLYTGKVYFLPLRSRGAAARAEALSAHHKAHPHRPACSPKSMYRFATEAGFDELKALAEANLFAQLDGSTILPELFSRFSSRHPDVQKRQAELLLRDHWTPATQDALAPLVARVVRGELPHAAPAIMLLLRAIPGTGLATAPVVPAASLKPPSLDETNAYSMDNDRSSGLSKNARKKLKLRGKVQKVGLNVCPPSPAAPVAPTALQGPPEGRTVTPAEAVVAEPGAAQTHAQVPPTMALPQRSPAGPPATVTSGWSSIVASFKELQVQKPGGGTTPTIIWEFPDAEEDDAPLEAFPAKPQVAAATADPGPAAAAGSDMTQTTLGQHASRDQVQPAALH